MTNNTLGILALFAAGAALVSYSKMSPKPSRSVLTFKLNPDGTCTYTYDDGSQEVGGCLQAPS